MAGGGVFIIRGSDGVGPLYRIYENDQNETPYDLTGAELRVDVFDAYATGASNLANSPLWTSQTYPGFGAWSVGNTYNEQIPLLTGTNLDGTIVVDDAANGVLHLVFTSVQTLLLFQRSWNIQRAPRRLEITIWRTDGGQNLSLYRVIEQARA
jgi:hypothetical protein